MVGAKAISGHVGGIFCQLNDEIIKYCISRDASWPVAKCHSEGKLLQIRNIRALMNQDTPELRETTSSHRKVVAVSKVLASWVSPLHGCHCI